MNKSSAWIILALLCLVLFVAGLGSVPLMGMDESLYSDTARHMLASGDYVTPYYNNEPFFDKPPLVYWLMAGSMAVFGVNSFAVRFPSAIAALLLVGLTAWFAARVWGRKTGLLTGFVLATSILSVALARMAILDMWFCLTISVSLGSFVLAYTRLANRWWYLLTWASAGLAVLVKGPAGVVVIGLVAFIFVAIRWRERRLPDLGIHLLGLFVFAAIAVPWYWAVNQATNGGFLQEFLFHQNIARAMGKDFYHNAPFYFYIPILLMAFFPWSVYLPLAWRSGVRLRPTDQKGEVLLFAGIWCAAVFVVLSIVTSKLPGYIYPIFPAAAMLVGVMWSSVNGQQSTSLPLPPGEGWGEVLTTFDIALRKYSTAAVVLAIIVAAVLFAAQFAIPDPIPGLSWGLIPMGVCMLAGAVVARWMLVKRQSVSGAFAALACGMVGFLLATVFIGLPIASRETDGAVPELAALVRQHRPGAESTILAYDLNPRLYSLPFYVGGRVELVYPSAVDQAAMLAPQVLWDALSDPGKPALLIVQTDRLPLYPIGNLTPVARLGKYLVLRKQ